jgi:hypothetical protein
MLALVAEINVKRLPRVGGEMVKRSGGMNPLKPSETLLLKEIRLIHDRFLRGDYTEPAPPDSYSHVIDASLTW